MNKLRLKLSDLWRWDGTIGRREYLFLGVVLFLIKYNIDRFIALTFFDRSWLFFDYFNKTEPWADVDKRAFYQALMTLALPFIWTGVVLTLRRLRSAGLALGWVVLFFVPFINLIFFALLSVIPARDNLERIPGPKPRLSIIFDNVIPESRWGSASAAIFTVICLTLAGTAFSTTFLLSYGAGLFVGMPFCLGMVSVLIYGYRQPRTFGQSMTVCFYSVIVAGAALLAFAFEGAICLIMAAPLALILALLGGVVAHVTLRSAWWRQDSDKLICAAILAIPSLIGLEHVSAPEAPLLCVRTAVEVKAPPETVWRHVVTFAELPPPNDWLFRVGIAYPVRAEINGRGAGAVRRCEFSTGPFIEPIEVWDEPRLLKFSVTANPAPLEEWTPYQHIHPPHLNGFLVSQGGQFLLTKNPDGSTHLEGTTWYRHNMWPADYWQIWSDLIIHRIHQQVLNHVKNLAEKDGRQ
jgi:hypothetical protein